MWFAAVSTSTGKVVLCIDCCSSAPPEGEIASLMLLCPRRIQFQSSTLYCQSLGDQLVTILCVPTELECLGEKLLGFLCDVINLFVPKEIQKDRGTLMKHDAFVRFVLMSVLSSQNTAGTTILAAIMLASRTSLTVSHNVREAKALLKAAYPCVGTPQGKPSSDDGDTLPLFGVLLEGRWFAQDSGAFEFIPPRYKCVLSVYQLYLVESTLSDAAMPSQEVLLMGNELGVCDSGQVYVSFYSLSTRLKSHAIICNGNTSPTPPMQWTSTTDALKDALAAILPKSVEGSGSPWSGMSSESATAMFSSRSSSLLAVFRPSEGLVLTRCQHLDNTLMRKYLCCIAKVKVEDLGGSCAGTCISNTVDQFDVAWVPATVGGKGVGSTYALFQPDPDGFHTDAWLQQVNALRVDIDTIVMQNREEL
eukprot:PhF_6_TR30420/c0_g1_i1/m.44623